MMMRFEDVIKVVCGNFICIADGKQYGFASKDEFKDSDLYKKICGHLYQIKGQLTCS